MIIEQGRKDCVYTCVEEIELCPFIFEKHILKTWNQEVAI